MMKKKMSIFVRITDAYDIKEHKQITVNQATRKQFANILVKIVVIVSTNKLVLKVIQIEVFRLIEIKTN